MAKNSWNDYSSNAASNEDVGGVDIRGTAAPSNFDDGLRKAMSHIADVVSGTSPVKDTFTLADPSDTTKRFRFDGGNVAASQTRVLSVPNYDGTIATLAGTETLTNKTLTSPVVNSPVLTTPQINDTTGDHQYVFSPGELAADRTVSLPVLSGNDTFLFAGAQQTISSKRLQASSVAFQSSASGSDSNYATFVPTSLTSSRQFTFPDKSGTLALTSDLLTSGTAQATTSGTSKDFTDIPSWVKRITVCFVGISTNSNSQILIQIGDSGGIENSGYLGTTGRYFSGGSPESTAVTTGFGVYVSNGTDVLHGSVTLNLADASTNTWVASGSLATSGNAALVVVGGSKSLSATLDRLRLTTVSGTAAFDAGSVNILYE